MNPTNIAAATPTVSDNTLSRLVEIARTSQTEHATTQLLWLDLTRKCQLKCTHCYNASGPDGTHGTMTREDWISVLDQAANCGVRNVQFIGGEPTLHPAFADLVDHALTIGLQVEVYSNLVHVSAECWALFQREGLTLATSYYSDQAEEHNAMTGRRSHRRTRANIERAVGLGIPLRVGIISADEGRTVDQTQRDLESVGVTRIGVDHVRPFGRGAHDQTPPNPANLCGRCGTGRAAISPTGDVSPCVFSDWMSVGNVKDSPLATILYGNAMNQANTSIQDAVRNDDDPCFPEAANDPAPLCHPYDPPICRPNNEECEPGVPDSHCLPRR